MQFLQQNGENRAGNRSKLLSTVWMEPFRFRADLRRDSRKNNEARGAREGRGNKKRQVSNFFIHSASVFRKIDADWTLSGRGQTSQMAWNVLTYLTNVEGMRCGNWKRSIDAALSD